MIVKKSEEYVLNVDAGIRLQILSNDEENLVIIKNGLQPVVAFNANDSRLKGLMEFINNYLNP